MNFKETSRNIQNVKLHDEIIINNIRNCPNNYIKFIGEIGKVEIIDDITFKNRKMIYVNFLNDKYLNMGYYEECRENKIIPCISRLVVFNDYNLDLR